jgi:hypothetical protein
MSLDFAMVAAGWAGVSPHRAGRGWSATEGRADDRQQGPNDNVK